MYRLIYLVLFLGCTEPAIGQITRGFNIVAETAGNDNRLYGHPLIDERGNLFVLGQISAKEVSISKTDSTGRHLWGVRLALAPQDTSFDLQQNQKGEHLALNRFGELCASLQLINPRQPFSNDGLVLVSLNSSTGQLISSAAYQLSIIDNCDLAATRDGGYALTAFPFRNDQPHIVKFNRQLIATASKRFSVASTNPLQYNNLFSRLVVKEGTLYTTIEMPSSDGLNNPYAITTALDSTLAPARSEGSYLYEPGTPIGRPSRYLSRRLFSWGRLGFLMVEDSGGGTVSGRTAITRLAPDFTTRWKFFFEDTAVLRQVFPPPTITPTAIVLDANVVGEGASLRLLTNRGVFELDSTGRLTRINQAAIIGQRLKLHQWAVGRNYSSFNTGFSPLRRPGMAVIPTEPSDTLGSCRINTRTTFRPKAAPYYSEPYTLQTTNAPIRPLTLSPFRIGSMLTCRVPLCDRRLASDAFACQFPVRYLADSLYDNQRLLWSTGDTGRIGRLPAPGKYWVRVTTPCFSYADTFRIQMGSAPVRLPDDTLRACSGALLSLQAPSGAAGALSWQDDRAQQTSSGYLGEFRFINTGQSPVLRYIRLRSDSPECTSQDSQAVRVAPSIPQILPDSLALCGEDTLLEPERFIPAGIGFSWRLPDGTTRPRTILARTPGHYQLSYSAFGCPQLDSTILYRPQGPELAQLSSDTCEGRYLLKLITDRNTSRALTWVVSGQIIADTTPEVVVQGPGTVYAKTTTVCGTLTTPSFNLAGAAPCEPLIPNIVSPGVYDGVNDTFLPGGLANYGLEVLSRWGTQVYRGPANGWPPRDTRSGVYYYRLTLPNGKARKGWVEVIGQ